MDSRNNPNDAKIAELESKIRKEQKILQGAQAMLRQLTDANAITQCQTTIVEAQKRIDFLESERKKLFLRMGSSAPALLEMKQESHPKPSTPSSMPKLDTKKSGNLFSSLFSGFKKNSNSPSSTIPVSASPQSPLLPQSALMATNSLPEFIQSGGIAALPANTAEGQAAFSSFDYWKVDSPITNDKLAYKIRETKWKLDVESKVKAGTERLFQTVSKLPDESKQRVGEVQEKLAEATGRVQILQKALHKYEGLWIPGSDVDDPKNDSRKTMTGKLQVSILGCNSLPGRKSNRTDIFVVYRVDNNVRGTTRPSKTARWNEPMIFDVDRAGELELTIYEKNSPTSATPLAMCWFRLADLAMELQRTKEQFSAVGSKTSYAQVLGNEPSDISRSSLDISPQGQEPPASAAQLQQIQQTLERDGLDAWLDCEPGGQIVIRLNFIPEERKKKGEETLGRSGGLARVKPVRKAFHKRGHKFQPQQFYQIMKCATCGEFLLGGQGYQCTQCKYTCHRDCYEKVIAKCITKAEGEKDDEEDRSSSAIMRHRIPHRWELTSILTPQWCSHCGYMLPLGKKQVMKCTECPIVCHEACMPLIPNLCGLSPEVARHMMEAIERAQRDRERKEREKPPTTPIRESPSTQISPEPISERSSSRSPGIQPGLPPPRIDSVEKPSPLLSSPLENVQAPPSPKMTVVDITPTLKPEPVPESVDVQAVTNEMAQVELKKEPPKPQPVRRPNKPPVGLDDFHFLAVLGKGNFGKVMLAEEKTTGNLFAIKVLKKEFIIKNDEVDSIKSEKRVFQVANNARHPFLVNLHSCFQTETRVYFVMEYISGGDLMWHIQHQQFNERRAKFYACEVLLALEYFHKNDIVYRDLKLDNILLALDGHIKLADYGLCKEKMGYGHTTSTFCGTPEFMAPEILMEKPYTRAVDWWAFGVLLYEMLLGQAPFKGDDEEDIFEAILEDDVHYPPSLSREAVDLLRRLLCKDPLRRLGSSRADADEIKRHPYFRGVDWDAFLNLQYPPPFIPQVRNATDVSNFDDEFTKEPPVLTPTTTVLHASDQEEFRGFTYVSPWALELREDAATTGKHKAFAPMAGHGK